MTAQKITVFCVKQAKQPTGTGQASSSQRQGTMHDLKKVQRLQKPSMCPDDEELARLLGQLAEDQPEQVVDKALKHLASYVLQIEHLERVPLAPRIKQLRQHKNPEISRTAISLVDKLREEVAAATVRRRANSRKALARQQTKLKTCNRTPAKLQAVTEPPAMPSLKKQSTAQKTPAKDNSSS